MQLIVANTTKQHVHFNYRLPENQRLFEVKVPIGGQERVHKADATSAEIDAIERQLRDFGAVRMDEVDRAKDFIGIAYSIDKAVKAEVIERAVAHNDDVLAERGYEQRKNSAVAISSMLTDDDQTSGRPTSKFREVSIVEEVKSGDTGLDETFRMAPEEGRGRRRRA